MIEAVSGLINSGVVLTFDVQFGSHDCIGSGCAVPECGSIKITDPESRAPILKGSKAYDKGSFVTYSESDDNDVNVKLHVVYKDILNTITVVLFKDLTKPRIKLYAKIPSPQDYEISEFFLQGNFDIQKVNIEPNKKTILGETFTEKLLKDNHLSIENKLFIQVVGPPLVKEEIIQSSHGAIKFIKPTLDGVEI